MKRRISTLLILLAFVMSIVAGAAPARAAIGDNVMINEFTAKGTEWIELFNPLNDPVDITGWKLSDGESDQVLEGSISAGEYHVINTSLDLSNDGDEILLFDAVDNLVDEVAYGTRGGAPLPPFGSSTARSPDGEDTDDFARDWNVDQTPTSGAVNDGPGTNLGNSIIINEQNGYYPPSDDFYELYNPTDSAIDLTGWQASDGDDIRDLSGSIPAGGLLVFTNLSISSADVVYLWDANGVRVDQLGRVPEFEDQTFQRIPDGVGPNDGYDYPSSGGGISYFDCVATPGEQNGIYGCDDPTPVTVTIPEIQGDGQFSPYAGELIETTGVVTLFTSNGANFWMQDVDGDGNPATSDGIFAAGGGYPAIGPRPAVGDQIRIIATVNEQQFGNALPLTRLTSVGFIEIISSNNPLPEPVMLSDLPDESIAEGIAFWEPLEGMLVSVENAPVVAATSGFGEFAMLTKDDAKPGSGFYPETEQILIQSLGENLVDYNPERVLVDDSTLAEAINVMPGDRVRSLVGVVDYTFGNYKLQPESFDVKTQNLPNLPASTRDGSFGDTAITTFNVENLFDLVLNTPTTVDAFGEVGFDPGSYWGPPNTQNNTLRRKPEVCQGDLIETDPFDPSLEWDGFGEDNFDGLGNHTVTCGTAAGLFISEYVEGSSNNKALEIYNGTGVAVNLSASGYAISIYFNGNTSPGTTIQLSGTLEPGEVFVVADNDADPAILAVADQISTASFFNGDDAVVLRQGGKDDSSSTPSPEELEIQLTKLALSIQIELDLPEIIVVQEVENTAILQVLGDLVNTETGTSYIATSFETSDGRGIEAGFLWDESRVTLLEAFQLTDDIVPGVSDAFGPTSASPGREPIVGVFDIEGLETTIVGNHFKSKGGDDPLFGVNWPPNRVTEVQRKMQAQVVRDFVNLILDEDPDALVMVAGDLNDFQFGEPGEGSDHPIAILEGGEDEVPLLNLVNLEKEPERFTYVFDGNSQVLDHMLISPGLYSRYVAVDALHFNASYPAYLGADASTPIRSSDHDALEGRFVFAK